jgi:predicted enzyme related to lactoylglutathione lyase
MIPQSLAGLIVYNQKPESLLGFYRDQLGIPLALAKHGRLAEHYEAMLDHSHVALLPGAPRLVPSFRVPDLDAALAYAEARGARPLMAPLDLGEGKRVAGLGGPDGFEIRLIEIHD